MTFLNPIVLLGLAAAGIPLIIHLFNFRRPQRIDFSSLAFVRELEQTTMRRVRIKQWLLLLMRTLALAALVLAFARPTLTGRLARVVGGDATAAVGILLDNSRSMDVRDTRGSVYAQATEAAIAVVENSSDGDEIFVLTTAGPASTQPLSFRSKDGARDFISTIPIANGATTTGSAAIRLADALRQTSLLNRELYIIGDAQRSTLGEATPRMSSDSSGSDVLVRLARFNDRPVANVGITSVTIESRIVELGQPVDITAEVANYSEREIDNYVASVFLEEQRVAQATVTLPPASTTTIRFTATTPVRGWLAGTIRGEPDDYESDDVRYFTLHVPEERNLLIVRGDGQRVDHIALALSPALAREGVFFRTKTIAEQSLPAERVDGYDAVVLVGLTNISSGEVSTLSQYVEQGGGLLIFPGAQSDFGDYDQLLQSLGGGRITGVLGSVQDRAVAASVSEVEFEHPLFDGVFDEESLRRGRAVEQLAVYFAAVYEPSRGTEQTLIKMTSGNPFMQEMRHGEGAALWISVAPDPTWSEFPVRGLFVPLIYRSVFYLSAGEQSGGEQLLVGRAAEIRLSGVSRSAEVSVRGPSGDVFVPEQRNLFGGLLLQTNEQITEAGVYDVLDNSAQDAPVGGDPALLRRVAYNLSPDESDLTLLAAREAAESLSAILGQPVSAISGREAGASEIGGAIQEARTGTELWNVCLMLALFFLAVEMLIEKHWRPEATS
jgi:hypothetical protein